MIGRLTWDLPGVEPVWQLGIFFVVPQGPQDLGSWALSSYMRRNNLKIIPRKQQSAKVTLQILSILHRKLATAHRITVPSSNSLQVVQWCIQQDLVDVQSCLVAYVAPLLPPVNIPCRPAAVPGFGATAPRRPFPSSRRPANHSPALATRGPI